MLHAGGVFDHTGGQDMTVQAYQSSIVMNDCSFFNIVQRGAFVDFDPLSDEVRFNGVITVLSASLTVQVRPPQCYNGPVLWSPACERNGAYTVDLPVVIC